MIVQQHALPVFKLVRTPNGSTFVQVPPQPRVVEDDDFDARREIAALRAECRRFNLSWYRTASVPAKP